VPLYEYVCRDCRADFEVLQRSSASEQVTLCPQCGSSSTRRKLSTFIVNGWTRGKPRRAAEEHDAEPDEYELVRTDHSDEPDWADF
jgi:putative FmdB family regulatory protein